MPDPSFSASGTRSITGRRMNTSHRNGMDRTWTSASRKRCGRFTRCRKRIHQFVANDPHECSDRAAYEDDPVWKAERAAESNWTKPRPSSIEIARIETAIVWPARYLGHVPQLLRTVQAVAVARARERDIALAARKLGLPG